MHFADWEMILGMILVYSVSLFLWDSRWEVDNNEKGSDDLLSE